MIHMKKIVSVLIAVVLLVLAVSAAVAESQGTTMYVKTPNGKALNVRSSMSSADDSNVIGSLRYGSKVITYGGKDGWLMIDYGNATGYIMAKYLVKEKPAPYDGSSSGSSGAKKAGSFNVKEATNVAQLNSLAASAKFITPYTVTVHPTTDDFIDKFITFAWVWFNFNFNMTILTMAAALPCIFFINIGRLADCFFICNLWLTDICFNLKFSK